MRPKQWSKNLLVFAAWGFAARFADAEATRQALLAFLAMCLASSGTYVVNDVLDAERDRSHPTKQNRPVASGAVPVAMAVGLALVLILGALAVGFALNTTSLALIGVYLGIQALYNWRVKSVAVLDVFTIATGFVLRAVLGAAAIGAAISGWLLFCTGALALMLGFAKRRHEFLLQGDRKGESRESLVHYTLPALDGLVVMFATGAAMCFGVYTLESETAAKYPALIVTAPFVFYAVTRYVLVVLKKDEGGEPADLLFGDPHILASVVLFATAAYWAMTGLRLPFLEP